MLLGARCAAHRNAQNPSKPPRDRAQESFKQEVAETFLRCVAMGYDPDLAVIELNGLKIAEHRDFADCARYIATTILCLCAPAPPRTRPEYKSRFPASAPDIATQVCYLAFSLPHMRDPRIRVRAYMSRFPERARYIATTILCLCAPAPPRTRPENKSQFPDSAPDVATQVCYLTSSLPHMRDPRGKGSGHTRRGFPACAPKFLMQVMSPLAGFWDQG